MVGALLLVVELSFERVTVLCYRPDVLRKLSPSLYANQSALHALPQQRLRHIPSVDAYPVAKRLVISGLGRWRKVEVTGISLVQRTPALPHPTRETGEHPRIRALLYSPLHVEPGPQLCSSSRHWPLRHPERPDGSDQRAGCRVAPTQPGLVYQPSGRRALTRRVTTVSAASRPLSRCHPSCPAEQPPQLSMPPPSRRPPPPQTPLTATRMSSYISVSRASPPPAAGAPGCSPAARAPALGAGDRRFESSHPDSTVICVHSSVG